MAATAHTTVLLALGLALVGSRSVATEEKLPDGREDGFSEDLIRSVSRDVACDYCRLLTEDMWSMTVQNVVGNQIDTSVEEGSLLWLQGLCRIDSELLQRFVGLYEFGLGTGLGGRHSIKRDVPWAGDPEGECTFIVCTHSLYQVLTQFLSDTGEYTPSFGYVGRYETDVMEKAGRSDRRWMHRIFARLCVDVVASADMEIAEALQAKLRDYASELRQLEEMRERPQPGEQMQQLVASMISDGKTTVVSDACSHVCEEFNSKPRHKRGKSTSSRNKKAKKDKKKKAKKDKKS